MSAVRELVAEKRDAVTSAMNAVSMAMSRPEYRAMLPAAMKRLQRAKADLRTTERRK